jgi:adenylate kinase
MITTDVILDNDKLREIFVERFKELGIKCSQLVSEMSEDGIIMDTKRLQRFISRGSERKITQKAYIWLLARHGVCIGTTVNILKSTNQENRDMAKEFAQAINEKL